jgi:pyruvate-formate lyase-activating enzyme
MRMGTCFHGWRVLVCDNYTRTAAAAMRVLGPRWLVKSAFPAPRSAAIIQIHAAIRFLTREVRLNQPAPPAGKLWIYTNYDCNLSCRYCVARSHPRAARRPIGLERACWLVDEAAALGFAEVFFTGGEPLLLAEIFEMLAHAGARMPTTLLTNGLLLGGGRLERLAELRGPRLTVQVSLDGATPAEHDAYRGAGTWRRTVAGIRRLLEAGLCVRISTTETPANAAGLDALRAFCQSLGIPPEDHFVRPLARAGFSEEGVTVCRESVVPELTVDAEGVYWHPLTTDAAMRVSAQIFPLAAALAEVQALLAAQAAGPQAAFT